MIQSHRPVGRADPPRLGGALQQGDGPPPVLEALAGPARHRGVLGEDVVDAAPRRVVLASLGGRQAELQVMGRLALVAEEEVAATE